MAFDPVVSYGFIAAGTFAQAAAVMLARRPLRLLRAGGRARGRVVGSEEDVVSGGRDAPRRFHFPRIAFTTANGAAIVFRSRTGRRVAEAAGTDVDVLYDPAAPHEAEAATFRNLWMFPLLASAFGLPFLVLGLAALRG